MVINHNLKSKMLINQMKCNQNQLSKNISKLSSGLRITKAADDSAGLAISEKMKARVKAITQAQRNMMDGIGLIQTTEGGMNEIQEMLKRMKELSVQAANGVLDNNERDSIQAEIEQLKRQIDTIANGTKFNEINTLAPPSDMITTGKTVDITFVIDSTTSMDVYATSVANNLTSLIENIKQKNTGDVRVSVEAYYNSEIKEYDFSDGQWKASGVVRRWESSDKIGKIETALKHIPSIGGKENNMAALKYAADNIDFREDQNAKHVILLTDERGDDNDEIDGAIEKLNEKGITVHSIYNKSVITDSTNGVNKVAEATGGIRLNINDSNWSSQLTDQIGGAIGESAGVTNEGYSEVVLQVGDKDTDIRIIELYYMRTQDLKIEDIKVDSAEHAREAMAKLDKALDTVNLRRSYLGGQQNRLEHLSNNTGVTIENETAAMSKISDVDMGEEMADFAKNGVLAEAEAAMLAQANQMPMEILKLLD